MSFVSQMSYVTSLKLNDNQFSGMFPSINAKKVIDLDISVNQLSGQFPDFNDFHYLISLNLSHNLFSGSVPAFQSNESLSSIDLSHNRIMSAKKMKFSPSTECSMSDNPLHCPIAWEFIQQCKATCDIHGDNRARCVPFHIEGDVDKFQHDSFLSALCKIGNITENRLSIHNVTKDGPEDFVAFVDIQSALVHTNQGSVEETISILNSTPLSVYNESGYFLLEPPGIWENHWEPLTSTRLPLLPVIGGIIGHHLIITYSSYS